MREQSMHRLTALKIFERLQDEHPERLPVPPNARDAVQTPLSLASIASLSGQLDELEQRDIDGLLAAAEAGLDYVGMGAVSYEQWEVELRDIAAENIRHLEATN